MSGVREIISVKDAIEAFIAEFSATHAPRTIATYRRVMKRFISSLRTQGIEIEPLPVGETTEDWLALFGRDIAAFAASTKALYFQVVSRWYRYLISRSIVTIDSDRIDEVARRYYVPASKSDRLPSDYYEVSRVVSYAMSLGDAEYTDRQERLRQLRDRAIIVTLADANIDLGTVCELKRGDIDWRRKLIVYRGFDGQQIQVVLSPRVEAVIRDYLQYRAEDDRSLKRSADSLPLFARHNRGTEGQVNSVSTRTVRWNIMNRVQQALGPEYDGTITPVSFRQYFARTMLYSLNILHPKVLQECQLLFESGRYDNAIFDAMKLVEAEIRSRAGLAPTDIGTDLVSKSMRPGAPVLSMSDVQAEQESIHSLYRGAIGTFKNPRSHRFVGTSDPVQTFECLALASMLIRMLEATERNSG